MRANTIGVDLAKNVFQIHGIAENDDVLFNNPLTASAIIASTGDAHQFRSGREFAAWLGLTPAN